MKDRIYVISLMISCIWLLSCDHKEIVCPGSEPYPVHVLFEWENAPTANPDGMTLYFYPESDENEVWKFDIAGREGGNVELPVGTYRMVAYNNDIPGIRFINQNHYNEIAAESRSMNSGNTLLSAGMLYGSTINHIEVTLCGISYINQDGNKKECPKSLLRCSPDSLTTKYDIVVRNVEGIEKVRKAQAILHGVARGIKLSNNVPFGIPSDVTAPMNIDKNAATFSSSIYAFSPDSYGTSYELSVLVELPDGKALTKKFDVTAQVVSKPHSKNVLIIIDGISIPDTGNPGEDVGGIDVGVDGWETIVIDIDSNDYI